MTTRGIRTRLTLLAATTLAGLLLATGCGGGSEPAAVATAPDTTSSAGAGTNGTGGSGSSESAGPGTPAQLGFDAATTDGGTLSGASLAGQPAVFWFWAPWCTICRGEAPEIARMHERFGDEIRFVGVAGLGQLDAMRDFVSDTQLEAFPHLVDDDGGLWSRFGVAAQPAFAFVTASGEIDVELGRLSEGELADRLAGLTSA